MAILFMRRHILYIHSLHLRVDVSQQIMLKVPSMLLLSYGQQQIFNLEPLLG